MTREIKHMIVDSGIEFKEIDYENVGKYLGEKMTIEEILDEEMEELLYIEEEKFDNLMKVKNARIKEVNPADDQMKRQTHNDCVENVTKNVTSVEDDGMESQAHKDCAVKEIVTNDVTSKKDTSRKS